MINIYSQISFGHDWLQRYQGCCPHFVCLLGFTATGLIPQISAAGATPQDRQYTAIADAEFLINGYRSHPQYPLPPLTVGVSPVLITRAVTETLKIPVHLFNTGLAIAPSVPNIDLGGLPANCLSTGQALPLVTVEHLFEQGLIWGEKLAKNQSSTLSDTTNNTDNFLIKHNYLILSECVVGGTTTALAVLTALGIDAFGKVNSSHPDCNHQQKWQIVQQGLQLTKDLSDPFKIIAAVGDPMQIVCAGMAISASRTVGVMLGGGTQMLAVYALIQAILKVRKLSVNLAEIVVGTTRWVAEDQTGDTVALAELISPVCLMATQLDFSHSRYPQLQVYERGFVKEGVGAGAVAIAASLYRNWDNERLVKEIELILDNRELN